MTTVMHFGASGIQIIGWARGGYRSHCFCMFSCCKWNTLCDYWGFGGSRWKPRLLIIQRTAAAVFLHVFRFGPIGCYSSSVCANNAKISKSSRRHGAIPASKFSSHINSRTVLLKSLPSCSWERFLNMLVKPLRTWGPYDFEATPPNDCMTPKEIRQYIIAWHSLICNNV